MASDKKIKNDKRRPVKRRSSLSRAQKKAIGTDKISLKGKADAKKKPVKKTIKNNKKATYQAAPKTNDRKQKNLQKPLLSIPFWRNTKLVLVLHSSKPATKKKQKNTKKITKKNRNTSSKKQEQIITGLLLLGGFFGSIFFGFQAAAAPVSLLTPTTSTEPQKIAVAPPPKKSLPRSVPLRLRAPDIQLDTALATVELRDGSIEVPADYTIAGWYHSSPTPGEIGPAIIVGHLDNIHGLAVFWRLKELVPGQIIEVSRADGTTARFMIEKVKQFPQDTPPTEEIYGNINHAGLRLITCGGTFNRITQHYSDNTVVFASLIL